MRLLLLPFISILALSSCQSAPSSDDVQKELKKILTSARDSLDELSPGSENIRDSTTQEIEKLHTFEYKVTELAKGTSSTDLEASLTKLGNERWECFHILELSDKLQIFCRRRPDTYLRYIPKLF